MKIIFDTNVWIALFNENDAHHEKAKQLFLGSETIYIPEYVILETTTVLQLKPFYKNANSNRTIRHSLCIRLIFSRCISNLSRANN